MNSILFSTLWFWFKDLVKRKEIKITKSYLFMQMWLMKLKCNEKQVWYEARLTKNLKKLRYWENVKSMTFFQIFWPSQNVFLILIKPFISEPCFVVYTKLPVTQHAHCLVGRFWFEIMPQWTLWSMSQGLQRGSIYWLVVSTWTTASG